MARDLLNYGAYVDFVQDFLVQAQYWHDPLHFDTYVEKSQFIAEVNNEKAEKNASYAINLASLENFVLVKHNQVICCLFKIFFSNDDKFPGQHGRAPGVFPFRVLHPGPG